MGEGRDLAAILCQTEASQLLIALILAQVCSSVFKNMLVLTYPFCFDTYLVVHTASIYWNGLSSTCHPDLIVAQVVHLSNDFFACLSNAFL